MVFSLTGNPPHTTCPTGNPPTPEQLPPHPFASIFEPASETFLMLTLDSGIARNCEGVDRRDFLKIGSLGGLGITLPFLLKQRQVAAKEGKPLKDVNCIFVWTQGGTSHHDTLDPKPQAADNVRGPLSVIDTA